MMTNVDIIVYGKLPQEGDFIFRGSDYKIQNKLESWSNEYMANMPHIFPAYKDYWLSAPSWSFCTPTLWFSGLTFGLLINSYDSVGREYPLIILLVFSNKTELLLFLGSKKYYKNQVLGCYKNLMVNDFILELDKIVMTASTNQEPLCEEDNEQIISKIFEQQSIWWTETRTDFILNSYSNMPTSDDLVLYYGL